MIDKEKIHAGADKLDLVGYPQSAAEIRLLLAEVSRLEARDEIMMDVLRHLPITNVASHAHRIGQEALERLKELDTASTQQDCDHSQNVIPTKVMVCADCGETVK